MATNLIPETPTRDLKAVNERNESGIYPPCLHFMMTFPVFQGSQIVNEGNFFFMGNFPLINAEGMIELENHLLQALK